MEITKVLLSICFYLLSGFIFRHLLQVNGIKLDFDNGLMLFTGLICFLIGVKINE